MIFNKINSFLSFKNLSTVFLIASLAMLPLAAFISVKSIQAEKTLDSVNLEARKSSGAGFYARAKRIFAKQAYKRIEIVNYLESVDYVQTEDIHRPSGFILLGKDSLLVIPQRTGFKKLKILFANNRIQRINIFDPESNRTLDEVASAELEGAALGTFISTIDGETKKKMFVRRYPLHFEDFKDTHLYYAILGSEDSLYMSHNGNRFDRIISNIVFRRKGGASSLDAQVVKNAVSLDKSRSLSRKIDEMFTAAELERRFTKEEIFTLYVNHVFLGSTAGSPNIYGFLAAARQYFGKEKIEDLTLNETAVLVALLPEPSNLIEQFQESNVKKLTELRDRVLNRMNIVFPKRYPADLIIAAKGEEIRFVAQIQQERPLDIISRPFVELVSLQQPMLKLNNLDPTEYSGLVISTSIDAEFMRAGQKLLNDSIPKIEARFPPANNKRCNERPNQLLGAIVAIDPSNGEIIAFLGSGGGKDGVKFSKLALNSMSPFASDIKPLWVVKAMESGSTYHNSKITPITLMGAHNSGRLRTKLAESDNDIASQLFTSIGSKQARNFFQNLTGNKPSSPDEQFSHGFGAGTEISPLRLSYIYTLFAKNGALVEPNSISQVTLDGQNIEFERPTPRQIVEPGPSFITTQLLRSVVGFGPDGINGTARKAFLKTDFSPNQIEIAGKTGSGPSSVYMVSVSPKLVITVWLGYQCPTEVKNSSELYAGDTAAEIWADFLKIVNKSRPDLLTGEFAKPSDVEAVEVNLKRRCRLKSAKGFKEYFLKDQLPDFCS